MLKPQTLASVDVQSAEHGEAFLFICLKSIIITYYCVAILFICFSDVNLYKSRV